MDHATFVSSLSRAERKALAEQSNGPALRHLAIYMFLICLFTVPIALHVAGWPLLTIPLGILLAFLFNLEHECTHKSPFRTGRINECAGSIAGFQILELAAGQRADALDDPTGPERRPVRALAPQTQQESQQDPDRHRQPRPAGHL